MTISHIPDEVMREIRAMASNLCKHDEYKIGTEEYLIAIHSYQVDAQAFYLKGYDKAIDNRDKFLKNYRAVIRALGGSICEECGKADKHDTSFGFCSETCRLAHRE